VAALLEETFMPIAALDPLALRVARRYVRDLQNIDPPATAVPDHRATTVGRVGREYQRRCEWLVPVDVEEDDDGDESRDVARRQG
jgi:hypothetical protein